VLSVAALARNCARSQRFIRIIQEFAGASE
jgi:hypothetical protein